MIKKMLFGLLFIGLTSCSTTTATTNQKVDTFISLGEVYAKAGRLPEAENYYQKAYDLDAENTSISFRVADLQVQQGKFAEAIQTYKQILRISPHNTKARYGLARATLSSGDLSAALTQYEILLRLNKMNYKALNGLGVLLDNLSHYTLAEACYKKGLSYSPQNYSLLNNLGVSYALSGNLQLSRHYLVLASQASPNSRSTDNLNLINRYYERIKNPAEREKELTGALLLTTKRITHPITGRAALDVKRWCSAGRK